MPRRCRPWRKILPLPALILMPSGYAGRRTPRRPRRARLLRSRRSSTTTCSTRSRISIPLAPLHNPGAVSGIEAAREEFDVPHVAIFDTAFFSTLPAAAATYAILVILRRTIGSGAMASTAPRISIVSRAAAELVGRDLGELNQIVLHLGNGCSASAVRGGVAVETSMGLTPLQGLVMGTRSGDVDPGLHTFLHNELGMTIAEIDTLLNKQSGLKGMAGVNDFRELEQRRCRGRRGGSAGVRGIRPSAQALRRRVLWHSSAGLIVLSFTAGVGENNPALRAAVVDGLDWTRLHWWIQSSTPYAPTSRPGDLARPARRSQSRWSPPTRSWRSPGKPPPLLDSRSDL